MGHQELSKRLLCCVNERRCSCNKLLRWLQLAKASAPARFWTRLRMRYSGLIAPRDDRKRTSAAQRGSRPRTAEQQRQALAFVAAEAKEKALPPLSVVLQLLSTTRNDRTTFAAPQPSTATPQKKLSAPEFAADAATTEQRCSPSSREQQDSPSRSRRARPSPATPGTSFPSVVKCEPRRRKIVGCSAR